MKFTDGYWLLRQGVQAYHPAQAYEIETGPDSMTVHAPTKPIVTRGDTLGGPMLSIRFSSARWKTSSVCRWSITKA